MTAWAQRWHGAYQAGEAHIVIRGHGRSSRGAVPLVWCHGALDNAATARQGARYDDLAAIADIAGVTVLAADLGGTLTWGNDTSIGRIDTLLTWAATNLSTRTDHVAVAGESMGGLLGLNWAWRNHTKVAAMWFRAPLTNLGDFHDTVPGFAAGIEAAYGGLAGYNAGLPTHDPEANTAPFIAMRDRLRIDAQRDDELLDPAWVAGWAATVGVDVHWHAGTHIDAIRTPRGYEAAVHIAEQVHANAP